MAKSRSPTNSGATVPPTTAAPTREQISKRAYEIWVECGKPAGQAHVHWSKAEQELLRGSKPSQ